MSMSSKVVFAEPHVITSKFLIREEVEKARGGAEIADVRKERDVFNKDITMMLRKPLGEHFFFNQEANISGPEGTGPEATEEDTGEEIVYRPPLQGRWKEGNEKTTLEEYEFTPRD
uniref:Uncharacterized protein n=1 Tax=Solanum tuberosum TaxID=4113 RepID=M1DRK1_SOLTU